MGKRKKSSRKPQGPRKSEPLPTTFACLFCNHEKSVTVKLEKKAGVGQLTCKVCGQAFQCSVNYLSAAVDVYSEWVDACDTVAKENTEEGGDEFASSRRSLNRGIADDMGADDIDDDESGAGYEGDDLAAGDDV